MRYLFFVIPIALLLRCGDDNTEVEPCSLTAEFIKRDYSKWICGGGWVLKVDNDTIGVRDTEIVRDFFAQEEFQGEGPFPSFRVSLVPLPEEDNCKEYLMGVDCISF